MSFNGGDIELFDLWQKKEKNNKRVFEVPNRKLQTFNSDISKGGRQKPSTLKDPCPLISDPPTLT